MPVSIIKLTESFENTAYEAAVEQLEAGQLLDLKMPEKNLWLATIKEGEKQYEVEVLLSGNQVKEHQCTCDERQECAHSLLTFVGIREQKAQQRKTRKKTTSSSAKRITTANLLKSVAPLELEAFVKDYARKNRQFSLALKTRFAAKIDVGDIRDKYTQLLEAIIKSSVRRNGTMTYKGYQKLIKSTKELSVQIEKNLLQQNYQEAFGGLQAIFDKIIPVFRKTEDSKGEIKANVEHSFEMLRILLDSEQLPPSFREEIRSYLLESCNRVQYDIYSYFKLWYQLLLQFENTEKDWKTLLQKIDEKLVQRGLADGSIAFLINLKSQILQKIGLGAQADELMRSNMENPEVLVLAIGQALQQGKIKQAAELLEAAKGKRYTRKVTLELEKYQLQVALEGGNISEILDLSQSLLLKTHELQYYGILKQNCPKKDWEKVYQQLTDTLTNQPFSMEIRQVLPQLFASEEDWEGLLKYIKSIRSLALLQEFDKELMQHDKPQVLELYELMVTNFVRFHLGRDNASKVRDMLFHLKNIGASKLSNKLLKHIRAEYPKRKTLMDELDWL